MRRTTRLTIPALILVMATTLALGGCGAAETATTVAPTVRVVATQVATNVPAGVGATAAVVAPQAATAAPGLAATAATGATAVAGSPSTGGPQASVTGQVTAADPNARTFTVRGTDGKDYTFAVVASGQVDFTAVATKLANQQPITVTYRGSAAPYEVVGVR